MNAGLFVRPDKYSLYTVTYQLIDDRLDPLIGEGFVVLIPGLAAHQQVC